MPGQSVTYGVVVAVGINDSTQTNGGQWAPALLFPHAKQQCYNLCCHGSLVSTHQLIAGYARYMRVNGTHIQYIVDGVLEPEHHPDAM